MIKAHYSHILLRAVEYAALAASRSQGMGDWQTVVSDSRAAFLRSISRVELSMKILNDRFREHGEISPFPDQVGEGEPDIDLIFSAVDGQKATAMGGSNTASFAMMGERGIFMEVPRVYMNKIIVPQPSYRIVDINEPLTVNIKRVARSLKKYVQNVVVCILDRPLNRDIIEEARISGAKLKLIQDGEISTALSVINNMNVDILVGFGGAQECVMMAGLINAMGGYIQCKFDVPDDETSRRLAAYGFNQPDRIFERQDLVTSSALIAAGSGITTGQFLKGVDYTNVGAKTHSFSVRGESKTFRETFTTHYFDYKVFY